MTTGVATLASMHARNTQEQWLEQIVDFHDRAAADQRHRPVEGTIQLTQQTHERRVDPDTVRSRRDIEQCAIDIEEQTMARFRGRMLIQGVLTDHCDLLYAMIANNELLTLHNQDGGGRTSCRLPAALALSGRDLPMSRTKTVENKARQALENKALVAARALVDRMRTLYRELERMTDAPITLHRALVCIGNEPGLTASKLAAILGMQRPAVSHVLKSLVARGWIERRRSEADQRAVRVYPTAAGKQLLHVTAGRAVGTLQRAVCKLSSRDLERMTEGIEAVLQHLPDSTPAARSPAAPPRARRGLRRKHL
jgi:DNA-binding MarR family transcriptional regulator